MKKWYRIGICLALSVCLLFLSACGRKENLSDNGSAQATGDAAGTQASVIPTQAITKTEGTQLSENPTETTGSVPDMPQEEENSNLPKELAFNWKESYLRINPHTNITHIQSGKLVNYAELQNEVDFILSLVPFSYGTMDAEKIRNLPFSEDFFAKNSLLLIGFPATGAMEITDVTYSDGVLTFSATRWWRIKLFPDKKPPALRNCSYCFIEIDTVLPEGTEIVVNITDEFVDEATVEAKYEAFGEKCI